MSSQCGKNISAIKSNVLYVRLNQFGHFNLISNVRDGDLLG